MNNARKIGDSIRQLADTFNKDTLEIYWCTVDAVDTTNNTCDVTVISGNADIQIPGVLLSSEPNDGFVLFPSIGSTVGVALTTRNVPFVLLYEDIDLFQVVVNMTKLIIQDGKIQLNDGSYGGLIKIVSLVTKLNNLENKVNDIISDFNSHTHTGVTTGGGTSGTTATPITGSLTPTNRSDIENDKIIHGQ